MNVGALGVKVLAPTLNLALSGLKEAGCVCLLSLNKARYLVTNLIKFKMQNTQIRRVYKYDQSVL